MLKFSIYIALKELSKKKAKIFLIILAVSAGVMTHIVTDALMKGWEDDITDKTVNLWTAHLKILPQEEGKYIENITDLLDKVEKVSGIEGVSFRLNIEGLILKGDNHFYCKIIGIDPKKEPKVTRLDKMLRSGSFLDQRDKNRVILGYRLAEHLGVSVGDKIFITFPNGLQENFEVKGIFCSDYYEFDRTFAFVPIDTVSRILNKSGDASEILIRLKDKEMTDVVKADIQKIIFGDKLKIMSWKELAGYIYVMLETEGKFAMLIIALILIVAGLGMTNAMMLTVSARTRYIGIMKAIGAKNSFIFKIYIVEALLITLAAIILGNSLAYVVVKYFEAHPIPVPMSVTSIYETTAWPFALERSSFIIGDIFALIVCIVAALYPAFKASKPDPAEAIKHVY